jgi:hypothetical protein
MKRPALLCASMSLVLACSLLSAGQEKGHWRAASSTAEAITGDIEIADEKISINFTGFTIAEIRKLAPAEISAAFAGDMSAGGSGNLYRLNIAGSKRFLRHNTLCGSEDTEWMATYVLGHNLQIAFFSGSDMPVFTAEAMANATNLCGTFSYAR